MNEVKKIHLGRQVFVISVEAHKALRAYLDAIEQQVGGKGEEVLKEVELRMAELLSERGISGEKVVLPADVAFLQEQLGEPADFRDEDETAAEASQAPSASKQLFRDTEHGMVAGVASGLAAYVGIDAVIVRLLFILAVVTGGWGILLYIILWLIVPEAKTQSDRLRMRGLAVTVDSLKQVVARADVPGAANRVGRTASGFLNSVGRLLLTLTGIGFLAMAFLWMMGVVAAGAYTLVHGIDVGGKILFPLGAAEVWLVISGLVAAVSVALLLTVTGISLIKRKWHMPAWGVAAVLGVFFVSTALATAISIDRAPAIGQRYDKLRQTQQIAVADFKSVEVHDNDYDNTVFIFEQDKSYGVEVHYFGEKRNMPIKTEVKDGVLRIDASEYDRKDTCNFLCINGNDTLEIIIKAPRLDSVAADGTARFETDGGLTQDTLLASAGTEAQITLRRTDAATVSVDRQASGLTTMALNGLRTSGASTGYYNAISIGNQGIVTVDRANDVRIKGLAQPCNGFSWEVYLGAVSQLTVNDERFASLEALRAKQNQGAPSVYNCIQLQDYSY